ncbi:MAG TPA: LysR family transcriptional regulator [Polyangiaceae bacterium]
MFDGTRLSPQLANLDLNLFLVLHTVLSEGSVTRAARKLSVTQSAVSNALAKLRERLGDPLFVRHGRGLVPTPRAEELVPVLRRVMSELEAAVDGAEFCAETTTRRFTLCWSDAQTTAHLSTLVPLFSQRLPRATLRIVSVDYLLAQNGFATGDVDAAVGPEQVAQPPLLAEPLYEDGVYVVARREHPNVDARLEREHFDAVEFVDVHLALGRGGMGNTLMTSLLARHGLAWKVGMIVPDFTSAAHATAASDYLAGLPARVARAFCGFLPLKLVELPEFLGGPALKMVMMWHPRTDGDPGARYFRRIVADACRAEPERFGRTPSEPSPPRAIHGRSSRKTRAPSSAG